MAHPPELLTQKTIGSTLSALHTFQITEAEILLCDLIARDAIPGAHMRKKVNAQAVMFEVHSLKQETVMDTTRVTHS